MRYKVKIGVPAKRDIAFIVEWIAEFDERAAKEWYKRILDAIRSLEHFPERCRLAPESDLVPPDIRQLLHGKRPHIYRILFTIGAKKVHVLHVRYGARERAKPEDLDLS